MNCKNCQTELVGEMKFCTNCGGKVIAHRLNFKSVVSEFFESYICWDNKFLITFSHLITKPQEVVNGYLNGVRKRYMQPFAYMIIALTVYGIYMYFAKDMLKEYMDNMMVFFDRYSNKNLSEEARKMQSNGTKEMLNTQMKYFNIITFCAIPFLAFINKLIFKQRNFIEHNIALLYSYASFLFYSSILGFIAIAFNLKYDIVYIIIMMMMVLYHMYFYKKIFQLDIGTTILKTLFFWLLLLALYLIIVFIGILVVLILLKTNIITR